MRIAVPLAAKPGVPACASSSLLAAALALAGCESNPLAPAAPRSRRRRRPADPAGAAAAASSSRRSRRASARAAHRDRRRLLRARPDGRRAARSSAIAQKLDPDVLAHLQHLRPRLRGDRTDRRRPRRTSGGRSSSRRTIPRSGTTGAGTCARTAAPRESIPEFELAIRNPLYRTPEIALVNAGKCSVAIGDSAARRRVLPARAADATRTISPRRTTSRCSRYKAGRLAEARALMRVVMQQTAPPPDALYLGMCIERKLGDRQAEQSYVLQLRNRYPDSAEALALGPGSLRVTETDDHRPRRSPSTRARWLRMAREAAGLSIDAVAQQLKLAPRQVKALEDDDFAELPGRTFVRGFVRNYARLLRLDPEAVVAALPGDRGCARARGPHHRLDVAARWASCRSRTICAARRGRAGRSRCCSRIVVIAAAVYEFMRPGDANRITGKPATKAAPVDPVAPAPVAAGTPLPNPVAGGPSTDAVRADEPPRPPEAPAPPRPAPRRSPRTRCPQKRRRSPATPAAARRRRRARRGRARRALPRHGVDRGEGRRGPDRCSSPTASPAARRRSSGKPPLELVIGNARSARSPGAASRSTSRRTSRPTSPARGFPDRTPAWNARPSSAAAPAPVRVGDVARRRRRADRRAVDDQHRHRGRRRHRRAGEGAGATRARSSCASP